MKKNSGTQVVLNYVSQHPGCSFQDIRRGTGLDSSVVNSSLWQMHRDGQVKRERRRWIPEAWRKQRTGPYGAGRNGQRAGL